MKCCPQWVIEIVAIHATRKYVEGNLPLSAYLDSYSEILSERYDNVSPRKLSTISEEIMNFLVEIDADDIFSIFDAFIFQRATIDENGTPRKIKTLFKNAFAPIQVDVTSDDIISSFKVFTFNFRASEARRMPADWKLADVDKIDWLGALVEEPITLSSITEF